MTNQKKRPRKGRRQTGEALKLEARGAQEASMRSEELQFRRRME